MNLRRLAKGRPCQVRVPGVCTHDPETTVLAHYRLTGLSGIGMKAPDAFGAWACAACHDAIDGRRQIPQLSREALHLMHAEGVFRTQAILLKEGVL